LFLLFFPHTGFDHVERCVRAGGVSTLLLTDSLFKSNVLADRIKYTAIVNSCQASAKVFTFSAANVTGERTFLSVSQCCLFCPAC
jgi:stalled ribosome rescue protein Dom34